MALTKIIGSGIGTVTDNVVITSDDPTITMTDSSGTNDIATLQSTSGALIITVRDGTSDGEIIFKGNTGSAVTEHARIANTGLMTVISEGNAVQTSVQQGLCKAWCKWSLADQSAALDSFNVGSITDAGTGTGTCNLTNAFSAATFATFHSSSQFHAWDDTGGSASTINLAAGNSSHSKVDTSRVHVGGFGDLA